MTKGLRSFILATVMLGLPLLVSCNRKQEAGSNTLKIVLKDDVKTLDPANAYDTIGLEVLPNVEETLLQYRYLEEQLVLEPLLAESMPEVSKDGLTVIIRIKKGVRFHDDPCFKGNGGVGRELTAKDFIFQFKRLALPAIQSQGAWVFEGHVKGFNEFEKRLASAKLDEFKKVFEEGPSGITARDPYTIALQLNEPYPSLNSVLAMNFTSPVPAESAELYADKDGNLKDHPVGTGPFLLKSWEPGQRITLVKNPDYHGVFPIQGADVWKTAGYLDDAGKRLPFVDGIVFEMVKEEQSRLLRFERGDFDLIDLQSESFKNTMIDGEHLRDDLRKKGVSFMHEDPFVMYYVIFNLKDKLLQNRFLRQAISSAINRNEWINLQDQYRGTKQTEFTPPGLFDRLGRSEFKYDFDLKRSKELLAKAGYPEGKGLPVINFDFRGTDVRYRELGEFFVSQLAGAGIRVNPVLNSFPAYLEKAKQGTLQVSLGGWTYDYPDVENGFQILYGPNKAPGPNDSNWENATFDGIYRRLAQLPKGSGARKGLIEQAEAVIQEELPIAYGYYQRVYRLKQKRLRNYRMAEAIQNKYKYIRLDR
jgi:ABC-type transport system substrate-binding protein